MALTVTLEPWADVGGEILPLMREGFAETGMGDVRRGFDLEISQVASDAAQGFLRTYVARDWGKPCGFMVWRVGWDPESRGLPVAQQVWWYARPEAPFGCAVRLFEESVASLRDIGIQAVFPHVRPRGRGAKMGRWLERRGARPYAQTYIMWIGDGNE